LINRGKLKKGEWCLVHAAAGGVGIAAVQIAKGAVLLIEGEGGDRWISGRK
jgi:NADPH2:quinone reductase